MTNHAAFVRAFHGARRKPWVKQDVDRNAFRDTTSVVTAYRDFLDFDNDFKGFCSILRKCAESQEMLKPIQDALGHSFTQAMD